jgi:putative transposase
VLRIVGVSEQTYYYNRKNRGKVRVYNGGRPKPGFSKDVDKHPISDEQISEWLLELVSGEEAAYGYRKLTICLRRQHNLVINKKKVYRLCQELDILRTQRRKRFTHPRRLANNREITGSNQLWEMDIKYGYIAGEQRFFFLMCIIDVYDRAIIDYHIGLSCEGKHAAQLLQRALWKRQRFGPDVQRPVMRTDNGPQFISHAFEEACETCVVDHERIPPKTPNKNAHIESFHAILENERLSKDEYASYQEAYESVTEFITFYNQRRIHGSLYDLSPEEFALAVRQQRVVPLLVKV